MIGYSPQGRTKVVVPVVSIQTGLIFASNLAAGSAIRLEWGGANLLSRTTHTAIWKAKYAQQTGYYAWAWNTQITGSFPATVYEYGTHPFPCDGTFDGTGQALGGTASGGTVHYYEIAGLGGSDFIASAGGSSYLTNKGTFYTQARTCEIVGAILRHKFYPDVVGNPGNVIVQDNLVANLPASPTAPIFAFGNSPWRDDLGGGGAGTSDETPSGTFRGFALFSAALSIADIATEAASDSNSAQTGAGAAATWYINKNPTPSDVTDKSGAGHTPSWANANRPTLYTN